MSHAPWAVSFMVVTNKSTAYHLLPKILTHRSLLAAECWSQGAGCRVLVAGNRLRNYASSPHPASLHLCPSRLHNATFEDFSTIINFLSLIVAVPLARTVITPTLVEVLAFTT